MIPSLARLVLYALTALDAELINSRRAGNATIEHMQQGAWPPGAQAHAGNVVHEGDVCPMMIVRCWGDTEGSAVNGQVFLDGTDAYWATSRTQVANDAPAEAKAGHWFEPPRVAPPAQQPPAPVVTIEAEPASPAELAAQPPAAEPVAPADPVAAPPEAPKDSQ